MRHATFLIILLTMLLLNSRESFGRRGRSRARSKSRVQIGLPITGKYRDTESDQYYNNDNVSINNFIKWKNTFYYRSLYISY